MKPTIILLIAAIICSFSVDKEAYQFFSKDGSAVDYEQLSKAAEEADVILFGEIHDIPIVHWLQLELTQDLFEREKLVLGAEMYEADDQLVLNEYLAGKHSYKTLNKEAKLWSNDMTAYRPLLDFAKENNLSFIATNIPRRYANLVYRYGYESLDALSEEALSYIAPVPFPYPDSLHAYKSMMAMADGHGGENLPKSQAIKDATMAHFILENIEKDQLFIHYNGSYHSDNFESIVWYLNHYDPSLKVLTISTVEQENITIIEDINKGKADFVLAIPANMTKSN